MESFCFVLWEFGENSSCEGEKRERANTEFMQHDCQKPDSIRNGVLSIVWVHCQPSSWTLNRVWPKVNEGIESSLAQGQYQKICIQLLAQSKAHCQSNWRLRRVKPMANLFIESSLAHDRCKGKIGECKSCQLSRVKSKAKSRMWTMDKEINIKN